MTLLYSYSIIVLYSQASELCVAAALIAGELQIFCTCLLWRCRFLTWKVSQDGQLGEGQESCVQGGNVASQAALGAFELSETRLTSLQCKTPCPLHIISTFALILMKRDCIYMRMDDLSQKCG